MSKSLLVRLNKYIYIHIFFMYVNYTQNTNTLFVLGKKNKYFSERVYYFRTYSVVQITCSKK
jgi:hypothetical protein